MSAELSDKEITRLCAEARGWTHVPAGQRPGSIWTAAHYVNSSGKVVEYEHSYRPLHDKAQAMELVIRHRLWIGGWLESGIVSVSKDGKCMATADDLLRAICLCVARLRMKGEG